LAIRIFTFIEEEINQDFWQKRIAQAINIRKKIGLINNEHTNCFRLVHGEGDDLPGLIIDFYNGIAVIQCHSVGMYLIKEIIAQVLKNELGDSLIAVYNKSEGTLPFKGGVEAKNEFLYGSQTQIDVIENDVKFSIDIVEGQKTGFFIDQRENRELLAKYSKDKKVLNTFCYSGGFSIYANKAGASLVHSVDSSAKAIALTENNYKLNFSEKINHESYTEDVMSYLNNMTETYDVIVLDPPAYAKHNSALDNALKGYTRLNRKAMEKIASGGILFTFSCSQVVTKEDFKRAIFTASLQSGRNVKILHQLHQPADHPISIFHPEGEYLKGLVLYVE
jgi:23S rRNA (cytosine1962-C5)-methyltransferase